MARFAHRRRQPPLLHRRSLPFPVHIHLASRSPSTQNRSWTEIDGIVRARRKSSKQYHCLHCQLTLASGDRQLAEFKWSRNVEYKS